MKMLIYFLIYLLMSLSGMPQIFAKGGAWDPELQQRLLYERYNQYYPDGIPHTEGVADTAVKIGREMGMNETQLEQLRQDAIFHDSYKGNEELSEIFNKEGKLTDQEYRKMRRHTVKGAKELKEAGAPDSTVNAALLHHKKLNSQNKELSERDIKSSYPHGKFDIPLNTQIITVADIYDARSKKRVYKDGHDTGAIVQDLKKDAENGFLNPEAVKALERTLQKEGKLDITALPQNPEDSVEVFPLHQPDPNDGFLPFPLNFPDPKDSLETFPAEQPDFRDGIESIPVEQRDLSDYLETFPAPQTEMNQNILYSQIQTMKYNIANWASSIQPPDPKVVGMGLLTVALGAAAILESPKLAVASLVTFAFLSITESPAYAMEQVKQMPDKVSGWTDKVKNYFESGEWKKIPSQVSQKTKDFLNNSKEKIKNAWASIFDRKEQKQQDTEPMKWEFGLGDVEQMIDNTE
ncbi:MAG: HD domain-containing protein [Spirochaetes bacterium]|nr:HD domain-containing protein [Spirochaetota bacterium]